MNFSLAISVLSFGTFAMGDSGRDVGENVRTCAASAKTAPWKDLGDKIDPSTRLIDTSNEVYRGQCYPEFRDKGERDGGRNNGPATFELTTMPNERTNWNLMRQPDGICMATFSCGFKNCNPFHDEGKTLAEMLASFNETEILDSSNPKNPALNPTNQAFALPSKVIFPQTAADVVETVKFAAENSIELSVKNSGHHYAGASTKANTLLVNMYEFEKYSQDSVIPCDENEGVISGDLENQPCQLARARGKPAYVRASGGESWSDVFIAVNEYNNNIENADEDGNFVYHVVGGAAGSVSPMGWTWQGGLGGTTGGGLYGFGLDQVLMIEAVLPSGNHVRFGPTEWEDDSDFDVPKTTKVEGVCNIDGGWEECAEDINFDDLWFAFRGGGGGTYGIVTSVYIQLHDYLPFSQIYWRMDMFENQEQCPGILNPEVIEELRSTFWTFTVDFLMDPDSLSIPDDVEFDADDVRDVSTSCGSFSLNKELLYCYAKAEIDVVNIMFSLWEYFIDESEGFGDSKEAIRDCPRGYQTFFDNEFGTIKDYGSSIMFKEGPYAGKKAVDGLAPNVCPNDAPCSGYPTSGYYGNFLLPKEWILKNKEIVARFGQKQWGDYYAAFGNQNKVLTSSDQANSLSDAHRQAGLMIFTTMAALYDIVVEAYGLADMGDGDDFPAFLGANHYSAFARGPLKSDWTKACPDTYTMEQRDTECVSLQEVVWGGKNLRRLQKIKEAIDPNFMFDCATCVGNNRKDSSKINEKDWQGFRKSFQEVTVQED